LKIIFNNVKLDNKKVTPKSESYYLIYKGSEPEKYHHQH
jgi:hypothetical protein